VAHTISALKRIRQNETSNARNRVMKSRVKTLLRKVEQSIKMEHKEEGLNFYHDFVSALDKAVNKNVFHKNNAARKKSKLIKKLNLMK